MCDTPLHSHLAAQGPIPPSSLPSPLACRAWSKLCISSCIVHNQCCRCQAVGTVHIKLQEKTLPLTGSAHVKLHRRQPCCKCQAV